MKPLVNEIVDLDASGFLLLSLRGVIDEAISEGYGEIAASFADSLLAMTEGIRSLFLQNVQRLAQAIDDFCGGFCHIC